MCDLRACFLTLLVLKLVFIQAKIYERCELAAELYKHNLPLNAVANYVCIAQHSSQFDTQALTLSEESATHGLFQISDNYWCVNQVPGHAAACNIYCASLRDDNLSDDVKCLQRIYAEHQRLTGDGYTAWQAYSQHCQGSQVLSYIDDCGLTPARQTNPFLQLKKPLNNPFLQNIKTSAPKNPWLHSVALNPNAVPQDYFFKQKPPKSASPAKIYNRCELAQELLYKHGMPMSQIPTWVCIAQHESQFDTSAVGRQNADGSADHGLFQISDLYWCAHDRFQTKACGLQCNKLLDGDITDDVRCIKRIHTEHSRIAGDGFTAWTVYEPHCRAQAYEHVASCFEEPQFQPVQSSNPFLSNLAGKVYKRCELAQELYFKHHFSMQDSATWVCIVQHESQFSTTAVVKSSLPSNKTMYHGIFQISDQYWCQAQRSHNASNLCGLPCQRLRDAHLDDDVQCLRQIYASHGFHAWPAYEQDCRHVRASEIAQCFDEPAKIYERCELAQELYYAHKLPMQQIPTWTCIAQHESQFNTAAVGRRNADGSGDFGLFQISDLYWCSHEGEGSKACNVPCEKLLDANITDDVHCIGLIYKEHKRLFGDGFSAWSVYAPFCQNQTMEQISSCFDMPDLMESSTTLTLNPFLHKSTPIMMMTQLENPFLKNAKKSSTLKNPFLPFKPTQQQQQQQQQSQEQEQEHIEYYFNKTKEQTNKKFMNNPFLSRVSTSQQQNRVVTTTTRKWSGKFNKFTTLRPYVESDYFRRPTTTTTTTTLKPTTRKNVEKNKSTTTTTTTTVRPTIRRILERPTTRTTTTTTRRTTLNKSNKLQSLTTWHWKFDTKNVTKFTTTTTTTKMPKRVTTINHNKTKSKYQTANKETITNAEEEEEVSNKNSSTENIQKMLYQQQTNNTRIFNTSLKTGLFEKLTSTTTKAPMTRKIIITTTTTATPRRTSTAIAKTNNKIVRVNIKFSYNQKKNITTETTTTTTRSSYAYRENPFDHPFFKQHKEQLSVFETTTINPKRKSFYGIRNLSKTINDTTTTTTTTTATTTTKKPIMLKTTTTSLTTTTASFIDYNKMEYLRRYSNSQRKPQYSFRFGTTVN